MMPSVGKPFSWAIAPGGRTPRRTRAGRTNERRATSMGFGSVMAGGIGPRTPARRDVARLAASEPPGNVVESSKRKDQPRMTHLAIWAKFAPLPCISRPTRKTRPAA